MSCKLGCITLDCSGALKIIRRCSSKTKRRKIVLLLVGLDNAGKSCTAKRLAQEPVDGVVPTVGFDVIKLRHRGFSVIIYDLGGGSQIRAIWPRYFSDVHGLIFVLDASDLNRIDESKKILEELLENEKLSGKPLLLLANKQDRAEALDEIDVVEKLNLEVLVNRHRCPTMVELCSAVSADGGKHTKLDPGLESGYKWILRRIRADYDELNARVEKDSEEQKKADEKERQERIQRQNTEEQTLDSLSTDCREPQGNPFKPISVLVKEQNGHAHKEPKAEKIGNGHALVKRYSESSTSSDSPDGSSHTIEDESNEHIYIPLHSPTRRLNHSLQTEAGADVVVVNQPVDIDVVTAVREQLELKMHLKKKKKMSVLKRNNKTGPAPADEMGEGDSERKLPPLRTRPLTTQSLPSKGWGLSMELEEVKPNDSKESVAISVLKSPRSIHANSDDEDDVVCFTHR